MVLEPHLASVRASVDVQPRQAATDRITIRLRPGDGQAIARRASQRGMKASAYLAALVRTHIVANRPLGAEELVALKQSVASLSTTRRLLAQLWRMPVDDPVRDQLERMHDAVTDLEQRMHDFAKAALVSWESRNG
jgi:hypothetical protein